MGKRARACKKAIIRNQQGQAVLEYMLMLSVALAVVTTISIGFKKSLFTIWGIFSKEISAPCPGCAADPKVQFRN
jgi:Flp pilus assembly pilin Flp